MLPPARLVKRLSWTEQELPQKMRTKHVHGLHPYFGKFVPQLVDYFLDHDLKNAKMICDPFMGSGTTLVESNTYGIPSIGLDISEFNVLLCNVKTKKYDIKQLGGEIDSILGEMLAHVAKTTPDNFTAGRLRGYGLGDRVDSEYLNTWYHPEALHALLAFRDLIPNHDYQDVMKIILSRSARSSRMIVHYETDHPKKPQPNDYHCIKHDRTCHPTKNATAFLKRYCKDVVNRLAEFQGMRRDVYTNADYGDSSTFDFSGLSIDNVFTSPPYIGLIDYHEQHRYAYELLELGDNSRSEIGSKTDGASRAAIARYKRGITKTIKNIKESSMDKKGSFIIVVNDKLNLYDDIVSDAGLYVKKRLCREVNRRSGRRATSFNEDILVCRSG